MGGTYLGWLAIRIGCDNLALTSALRGGSAVQGSDAPMWSAASHWVFGPCDFLGGEAPWVVVSPNLCFA